MAVGDKGLERLTLQTMLDRFAELAAAEVILGNYKFDGLVQIKERAASGAFTAAYGQLWIKDTSPAELWFADDTGLESQVMIGGGAEINDLSAAVTWANIPQANIPDPLLMGDGSAAAPSYSFSASGQQDVGFYRSATDSVSLALGGVAQATWDFTLAGISGVGSDRPAMRNVSATATVPSLTPRNDDSNTGIGRNDPDQLSLIAGGVEIARAIEAVNANQFAVVASGAVTVPDLTGLADPDTGFSWTGANQINVLTAGSLSWGLSSAKFFSALSDGPCIANIAANQGIAVFRPDQSDTDTGLGYHGIDSVSLVAGGIAGLVLKELNSGVVQVPIADVAITAFATGGQGSAVALKQSYNVISVCATAGDSVKLPPVFLVDSIVYIKNDGAESCDVFPASGDNLGQGADTAEALASGVSATYIATAANATWTLLLASAGGGADPSLLGDGTVGAPTYSFASDTDMGMYLSGSLRIAVSGSDFVTMDGADFRVAGDIECVNSAGGALKNETSSATNPTVLPNSGDIDTGLGTAGGDILSLIAGGVEIIALREAPGANQIRLAVGVVQDNAAAPTLAFGDTDTGFYESADDVLKVSIAGVARWEFNGDVLQSENSSGPAIRNIAINAILPQFCPNQNDLNTGLGSPGQDEISMIAGGVEGVRYVEGSSVRILASYQLDDTLTAFAGGGQGSATLLGSSYNEFTVVATAGDSAKLMVGHPKGTKVFVKNNGANSMDIFPAVGDQIDTLGLNNAVSLPAGKSILFMTTTGNNTWTVMDFTFGDGDVTKVGTPVDNQIGVWTGDGTLEGDANFTWDGNQVLVPLDNDPAAPTIAFGNGDSGFYEIADNNIGIAIAGLARFIINASGMGGRDGAAGFILDEAATATNPTVVANRGDLDSGLGSNGQDTLTLVAGGLDCINIAEVGSARKIGFYVTAPIVLQTGVAVTAAGVHAALVNLGLITA